MNASQKDYQRRHLSLQLAKAQDFPSRREFVDFWNLAAKCPALVREIANFDHQFPKSIITADEALEIYDLELIQRLHAK